MATRTTRNDTIKCGFCAVYIDEAQYRAHVAGCGLKKVCALCGKEVDNLAVHYARCTGGDNRTNYVPNYSPKPSTPPMSQYSQPASVPSRQNTKKCSICSQTIPETDFLEHVDACRIGMVSNSGNTKNTQKCIICSNQVDSDGYNHHVNTCLDRQLASSKNTKECIISSRSIAESDYMTHADKCLRETSSNSKPPIKYGQKTCFTCSSPVDISKTSSHTIPCQFNHIYCLKCLQRSMNEYLQSNTAPVCHSTHCNYELSRYDVACLPLEENIIQRLLPIVKSAQRPQCPVCFFYVEFNTMEDLQKHVLSCEPDSLIPCEYCHCLFNKHRLDNHSQQCRNVSRSQQQQAFADFLLSRTKYPLTATQLRVFIDYQKKNRLLIDPHSIVDALTVFGDTFPFDVPTYECGVCADTHVYDDIFVFGCEENHKVCYACYERSCKTKMNSNEILTCALCSYQLQYGEMKYLRISDEQKKQMTEYQTQKTFSAYSDGTRGVLKCPNKGCKWVAEAENANEQFKVTCRSCQYEFCSLCSQQYHYRTTCQQMPELTQRWFFWCNTERGNYWQARAQQDATFRAQLEDHQQQIAANVQRNNELRQRYDELLADETYKAQNCRICPNCERVVQHLGGCDAMVCGKNYHGGDVQSGCGRPFNWSQAKPYAPIANTGPNQITNDLPPPEQQKAVVHEGFQCDACHNEVQGIRFDCIHCPSLIYCEKCEQRATLEHSSQIRDQQKQQHVFQLITRSTN